MNYDYEQTPVSKALFIGLFSGISATLLCLFYHFFFMLETGFPLSIIFNVATIIIASILLFLVVGLFYYWFSALKGGRILFILSFIALTLFCLFKTRGIVRSDNDIINVQFRWLLSGIIIIYGTCSFFLIPFLHKSKTFEENIL